MTFYSNLMIRQGTFFSKIRQGRAAQYFPWTKPSQSPCGPHSGATEEKTVFVCCSYFPGNPPLSIVADNDVYKNDCFHYLKKNVGMLIKSITLWSFCWLSSEASPSHTWYLSRTPQVYSCKFFLAGVNLYRFNAKNCQFTVYFAVITQTIGNFLCILS